MRGTRRTFLFNAMFGATALATGWSCSRHGAGQGSPPRTSTRDTQRLGVALLGLGSYSQEQLAPALQLTQHCALQGIVTGSPAKIPAWQSRYGIADPQVYDYASLPRLANDDSIQVVYIVVPPSLHAKYAVLAAEAGKHVWCEKPMATSSRECEQIIAACRDNGVKLSIGYRMQHEPNTRTVIGYARSKPYGPITGIRAEAGFNSPGAMGWRLDRAMGGGALYDMGVYSINAIRYASGEEPVRVIRAQQSNARPELFGNADETTEFELELPSGVVAHGRTSFGEEINELRVSCERGGYELAPMQKYQGVKGRTSDGKLLELPIANQQARQMDDDALAILENRPVMVPGEEGLRDVRIVEAIMQAAQTSRTVELP